MSHWRLHPELPIFGVEDNSVSAVYIPGHVMPVSREQLLRLHSIWAGNPLSGERQSLDMTRDLAAFAADVKESWRRLHYEEFAPVCLNIQLPYSCSLACNYCYARPKPGRKSGALDRQAATAAARLVSKNCASFGVPFQVDINGEGEPACQWDDLQWCVEMTQAEARDAQVAWSAHLTTNGQMDTAQADWIGRTFTHVTLSCDGPPDIQNICRPCRNGKSSSSRLEVAAKKLVSIAEDLDARVTVTAANIHRLNDVVEYISAVLGIRSIRLEPAFAPVHAEDIEPDPAVAAEMCLRACETGEQRGIEVTMGSPRLTELHGTYCQVLRGILRIMPDGTASNCMHGVRRNLKYSLAIGRYNAAEETYTLDMVGIDRLRRQAENIPARCHDCLNVFHCCLSCPDQCPTADMSVKHWRCRFQEFAAEHWILAMAGQVSEIPRKGKADLRFRRRIETEIHEIHDPSVRYDILVNMQLAEEWRPLDQTHMPKPTWEDKRYLRNVSDDAEKLITAAAARNGNISVYVHLPFCRKRCIFCDCHSVVATHDDERFTAYIERLKRDLDIWCERGLMRRRPVSTIHFGGGTPLAIGEDRFSEIVNLLDSLLNVNRRTQWAIETTAALAAARHIDRLKSLGFRRLHVGVQTLNDALRRKLGRTSSSSDVVERLYTAMEAGMATSVDLIYGLPDQTVGMLLDDISRLIDKGVHGFSLYRLNLSQRNKKIPGVFPGYRPSPLRSCVMLQAAESLLVQYGYGKNHFAHYALPPDDNLYYRHAVRGEDMLGLGASASGVIGDWEYRYAHYPRYLDNAGINLPIELLTYRPMEAQDRMIETGLMAGRIPVAALPVQGSSNRLIQSWIQSGLLARDKDGLRLTATGTFMSGIMLEEFNKGVQIF